MSDDHTLLAEFTNDQLQSRAAEYWVKAANALTKADRDGFTRVAAGLERIVDRREQRSARRVGDSPPEVTPVD
jgi:hypothetical protein